MVLAAPIYHADVGDPGTMVDSVMEAQTNLSEAGIDAEIEEAAADKGYHATDTLELADALNIRTYIPGAEDGKGIATGRDVPEEKRRAVSEQPSSCARRTEQAAATSAKRTGGTELRPCVRNRRCPTKLAVWDREGSKALPDCRGGPEPGLGDAQDVRNRDTEGLAGRGRPCLCLCRLLCFHIHSLLHHRHDFRSKSGVAVLHICVTAA